MPINIRKLKCIVSEVSSKALLGYFLHLNICTSIYKYYSVLVQKTSTVQDCYKIFIPYSDLFLCDILVSVF